MTLGAPCFRWREFPVRIFFAPRRVPPLTFAELPKPIPPQSECLSIIRLLALPASEMAQDVGGAKESFALRPQPDRSYLCPA